MNKPHDPLPLSPAIQNFARQDNTAWSEAEWPALREGARVGATPPPGRPKAGCAPSGGSDRAAGAWGLSTFHQHCTAQPSGW